MLRGERFVLPKEWDASAVEIRCAKKTWNNRTWFCAHLLAFVFQGSVLRAGSQALCECDPVCRVAWRDKNHQTATGQAKQLSAGDVFLWGKTWQSCWSLFLVVSWLIIWGSSPQALLWCKRFSQIFSWKLLWWTKACERLPCGDYWLPSCKWTIKKGICVLQA